MKKHKILYLYIALTMALSGACTASSPANQTGSRDASPAVPTSFPSDAAMQGSTPTPPATVTEIIPVTSHVMRPAEIAPTSLKWIDDVESSGTGPEGRAPYGDSYKLNRFERPFLQDMTYVPDSDIHKFGLSEDQDWYYVSIQLIGNDPNYEQGIHYAAEIDLNADGFGDYLIWARPPYKSQWDTSNVQVFQDSDNDAGGLSSLQSDAVFEGNGYDTLVFDGSAQENADPDLAWVRVTEGQPAIIQFAFKKSLTGSFFMLGVVSDMGLKDVSKYDYADRFAEADAGSPVRSNQNYPLGMLYGVDNTCWEAYGIQTTGFEPKLCQPILQPTKVPSPDEPSLACVPEPACEFGYNPATCECYGEPVP